MNKYISFLVLFFLLFGCKKDEPTVTDPCDVLVDGVYPYPRELPDTNMTPEEKREFWNVPEDVLPCLETDGLVETCLNHKHIGFMLMAGCCGLQSGYDLIKGWCRGFSELEKRPDALDALIAKYKSIDTVHYDTALNPLFYGGYKFYTYNMEAILAQEVFLKNATKTQKIELLTELLAKQDFRGDKQGEYGIEGPSYVMARLMYYDNYGPLVDEYNQNSWLRSLIIYGSLLDDIETRLTIYLFAKDYLVLLKNE